jgi:ferredoxin--NADP+ reductase
MVSLLRSNSSSPPTLSMAMAKMARILSLIIGAVIVTDAFVVIPQRQQRMQQRQQQNTKVMSIRPSRRLSMATTTTTNDNSNSNNIRIKKAGGGITTIPSGSRDLLWDPASEGMCGMDGDLSIDERILRGIDFSMTSSTSTSASASSTSSTSSSNSVGVTTGVITSAVVPEMLYSSQCWLEYLDQEEPYVAPTFAKATNPVKAIVLGRTSLIEEDAPGDIQHIVLRLPEGFHYVEGQSLSVIPPGLTEKGKKQKPRLYSIASTRYGDLLDGTTVSLCVRKAEYYDPITGTLDDSKAGICSKFLCSATPGTEIDVAGPIGKTMILPKDSTKDIIMVATGTGIAPFRSFLHRLFVEQTTARHMYTGTAWLILGVPTTGSLLYKTEFDSMLQQTTTSPQSLNNLKINYAISREMTNKENGGKLYVQDVLKENAIELFAKLEAGAVIYFCGLKGMMPGILLALEEVATSQGIDWSTTLKKYQSNHQWHVEVY